MVVACWVRFLLTHAGHRSRRAAERLSSWSILSTQAMRLKTAVGFAGLTKACSEPC